MTTQTRYVSDWSVVEVSEYLQSTSWIEKNIISQLVEHEVDGAALLELTKEDLREDFNVRELGKVKRILRGISKLQPTADDNITTPECDLLITTADLVPNPPKIKRNNSQGKRPATATAYQTKTCVSGNVPISEKRPQRPASASPLSRIPQTDNYSLGILEAERRYSELCRIHSLWEECVGCQVNIGEESPPSITMSNIIQSLRTYFNWTIEEAHSLKDILRTEHGLSESLTKNGFSQMLSSISSWMSPIEFDSLKRHVGGCVAKAADVQENQRREMLAAQLFRKWDYDGSEGLSQEEYDEVLVEFQKTSTDIKGDTDTMKAYDHNGDGCLDISEFTELLLQLWKKETSHSFDTKYFRLSRVVDDVVLCNKQHYNISADSLSQILTKITSTNPLILYGTSLDPSRAVEEASSSNDVKLNPILVTHKQAEQEALDKVSRLGFGRGHWIYLVIGQNYEADEFYRALGLRLQTLSSWMIHSQFRLIVMHPYRSTVGLPSVLLLPSVQLNIDNYQVHEVIRQYEATRVP